MTLDINRYHEIAAISQAARNTAPDTSDVHVLAVEVQRLQPFEIAYQQLLKTLAAINIHPFGTSVDNPEIVEEYLGRDESGLPILEHWRTP